MKLKERTVVVTQQLQQLFLDLSTTFLPSSINPLNPHPLFPFLCTVIFFSVFPSSMASSDSDTESSFLEQLISSRNRDLSLLLPLILGFSNSRRRRSDDEEENPSSDSDQRQTQTQTQDRIILINPFTQGMIVIESSRSLDAILREISDKDGLPPASKTSIESMPKVEITQGDLGGECAICLEGWEIASQVKEMPCKHKYHSNCIEKWLGIHGSCPVCRFEMPVDDDDENCKKRNNGEVEPEPEPERDTSFEREVWVSFSFNRRRNSTTTTTTTSNQTSDEENSTVGVNGSSSESSTNEEEEEEEQN